MFEQAILKTQRRPWTLAASLTLQSAAAGAVVLLSIITIERLPNVALPVPLPPVPAPPRAVEIVRTEIQRIVRTQASGVFTAPVRIPQRIAMIMDEVAAVGVVGAVTGLVGTGLPAGMYTGTSLFTAEHFTPPPPASPPSESAVKPAVLPKAIAVSSGVLEGRIIRRVIPTYPPLARQARISGTVKLHGIISRDGAVKELKVLSGHPLLVPAAVEAVRQWLYRPTLLNGEPVEVNAPIEVHFTLAQ